MVIVEICYIQELFSDKMKLLSVKVVVTYGGRRVSKLEVSTYRPEEALGSAS